MFHSLRWLVGLGLVVAVANFAASEQARGQTIVTYYPSAVVYAYRPTTVRSRRTAYVAPVVVNYAAPAVATTTYFAPTTTYYAPPVVLTTTFYAPTTTFYAPPTALVAPTTTYFAPAATCCQPELLTP